MTRQRGWHAARTTFVVLAVVLAWWGLRGRWSDIGDAAAATGLPRSVAAVGCAALGVAITAVLWRRLLLSVGSEVGVREAGAVFLVGQLGKYLPGSVWSVAAQAQLGRRHGIPARSSASASVLFLLVHTATGLLLGGAICAAGALGDGVGTQWLVLAVGVGAAALAPPLLRRLGERLAGDAAVTTLGATDVARSLGLMALVWACYGTSLLLLLPGAGAPGWGGAVAAFALAHAVGVLVVVAPAGVGAREAVLVTLLSPSVGVPAAAAAALLARVAHVLADFIAAGAAAGVGHRARRVPAPEPARASGR